MEPLAVFTTYPSEAQVLEADPADGRRVVRVHHAFQRMEVEPEHLDGLIAVLTAARAELRGELPDD